MNNSVSNNTNFKGAFLVKYPKTITGIREGLEKNLGNHGKSVFESFGGNENTVLYILRNNKDYDVAKFINKNSISFRYLPEFDTKALYEIGGTLKNVETYLTENKSKFIQKASELMEFVNANREGRRSKQSKPKTMFYETVKEKLKINIQGKVKKNNRGVYTIEDKEHNGLLSISPKSKLGFIYVYVKPSNEYDPIRRYAVNEQGDIVATFQTPAQINKFKEMFKKAARDFLDNCSGK